MDADFEFDLERLRIGRMDRHSEFELPQAFWHDLFQQFLARRRALGQSSQPAHLGGPKMAARMEFNAPQAVP
ncbi:hypothetical protein K3148_00730 [Qipengyuania aurantiaca]|uniref:Uncharacterized protein n=1 Tax=Qipengyuania aurantiaca TaxID=2867233 RepID=A0ABX8ZLT5_9SPHN|nr:hypothetical protein [Qipengyuania aurantiaca]QZD89975.1 hypothetical protein K3148_00730 [Qipengyuania aurantiaca]